MTLLDLTVYLWSGWPRGVAAVQQTLTGHIVGTYTTGKKRNLRNDPLPLCTDHASATVTREMFVEGIRVSMRPDVSTEMDLLPNCRKLIPDPAIRESRDYEVIEWQYNELKSEPTTEQLLCEIVALRIFFRDIIGIHIATVRDKRRAARKVLNEQETLVWQLGRHMPTWPAQVIKGVPDPYFADFVTQDANGQVFAHFTWNKEVYSYPWNVPGILQAKDILRHGVPQQVTRDKWGKARDTRIERERSIEKHLKQTAIIPDNVYVPLQHGEPPFVGEQASDTAFEFDAAKVDKYGDPI